VTPNDVRAKLQIEAGQGLMAYLEEAVQTGKADPSALFAFFGLVNDTAAMEQSGWEVRVQEALARLTPDAIRVELEQRAAHAEQRLVEIIETTKQQLSEAEAAAKEQAIEITTRALTALLATGNLPEWLLEARPELEGIALTKSRVSTRKAAANSGPRMPTTRADALRFFLSSLDISPAKHWGIWIPSSGISVLNGGATMPETPTELAKMLGKGAKDGAAYIAPLDKVTERLFAYHCVPESVANAWLSLPQSGDNAEPIDLQSRRQA
jgi:hypothetical protein